MENSKATTQLSKGLKPVAKQASNVDYNMTGIVPHVRMVNTK